MIQQYSLNIAVSVWNKSYVFHVNWAVGSVPTCLTVHVITVR